MSMPTPNSSSINSIRVSLYHSDDNTYIDEAINIKAKYKINYTH